MDGAVTTVRISPRIISRGFSDFCIVSFVAFPVLLLALFIVPGVVAYLLSGSRLVGVVIAVAIYLVFLSFSVWSMSVSPEGIRFHRWLGSPKFLPWSRINAIAVAPRRELILRGWFWPLLPAREMTASLTSLQHYRINWDTGFCYYPPADPSLFEEHVSKHLWKPLA
jgi:hypothetical protein